MAGQKYRQQLASLFIINIIKHTLKNYNVSNEYKTETGLSSSTQLT